MKAILLFIIYLVWIFILTILFAGIELTITDFNSDGLMTCLVLLIFSFLIGYFIKVLYSSIKSLSTLSFYKYALFVLIGILFLLALIGLFSTPKIYFFIVLLFVNVAALMAVQKKMTFIDSSVNKQKNINNDSVSLSDVENIGSMHENNMLIMQNQTGESNRKELLDQTEKPAVSEPSEPVRESDKTDLSAHLEASEISDISPENSPEDYLEKTVRETMERSDLILENIKKKALIKEQVKHELLTNKTVENEIQRKVDEEIQNYKALLKAKVKKQEALLKKEKEEAAMHRKEKTEKLLELCDNRLSGYDFEYFCSNMLKSIGFKDVHVTQSSNDSGVDITAVKDSVTYAVQCKCYNSNVGRDAVQEVYSGMNEYQKMVSLVITNSHFTDQAKETARKNKVILWDRKELKRILLELDIDAFNSLYDFYLTKNNL